MDPLAAVQGNFVWDIPFRTVRFEPSKSGKHGKWIISLRPREVECNRMVLRDGVRFPENPDRGILGVDPFKLEKTAKKVGHKGISKGGAVGRLPGSL
jgi:hypothetical protein